MTQSLPHRSVGFYFTSDLPFLTLKGVGFHYVDSHEYSWDNRRRKDNQCLIQYCVSGEIALEMDGILYSIQPGNAFVIDLPGNSRYYLPEQAYYGEFLYLEFSKECLPLLRKIYQHTGPILYLAPGSALVDQMFSIYQKALGNELKTFFENTKAAYSLWIDLTSYALTCSEGEITRTDHAKMFIDQNYYKTDLNLDLVAEHARMSKYYMCKEFHKKYGISPGKYLRELRISQACRLLTIKSGYTIQDIAQMVGYTNNNYFGKVFKAVKGITPDQFRKQSTQYDFVRAVYETSGQIYTPGGSKE